MKARELIEEVRHLEGLIGVWSFLREKLDSDLIAIGDMEPHVVLRDVRTAHITEVGEEMDSTLLELQETLDDLLGRDMKK
jgi:hypothetical protein